MESLLANFDIDKPQNFWKLYPSWKTPKILYEFYNVDKSQHKNQSSTIMWAIIHMFDKTENNPYRLLDYEEKIGVINDDIIRSENFNWDKYSKEVDCIKKLMTTELERSLDSLNEYIEKRRKFIEEQQESLDFEIIKAIDTTIKANKDLLIERDRLIAAIELSDESGTVKGGKIESLSEKGEI